MKSQIIFLSAALFVFAACKKEPAGPKKLGSHTAAVVFVSGGDVRIVTKKGETKAVKGAILNESDRVQTGPKAHLDILLPNNIILRVAEKSTLEMKEFGLSEGGLQADRLMLHQGAVFAKVAKLNPKSSFAIQTPTVVAGVRGTKFLTETDEKGAGKVSVTEGNVGVESKGKTEDVAEGEQAQVSENGAVTETKIDPATAARINEMSSGVDKIKQEQLQIFENLFKNQKEALEKASGDTKIQDQMKKSDEAIGNIKNQTDQKIKEMKATTDTKMKEATEKVQGQDSKTQDALEKAKGGSLEEMRKKQQDLFNKQQ